MLWLLPLAVALFFYNGYREIMALPPMWNLRAMTLQNRLLLDLVIPVTGAAAWMGSREGRRDVTDLLGVTARPRWTRQLATWAATTVTSGVTNRPGNQAPTANPTAVSAGTPAALTTTGHHSGPPQDACRAVMRYTTATQIRQASSAQAVVAAQVAS